MNYTQDHTIDLPQVLDSCNTTTDVFQMLKKLYTSNASVCWDEELVSMNLLINFINKCEEIQRKQTKRQLELQKIGIQNALEKKKHGKGSYGRPKVPVPNDFAEVVRYHKEQGIPLINYQKKLGMSTSTFYKRLSELKKDCKHKE